jgi:hypothetical protein
LIDMKTGQVIEFVDEEIEALQEALELALSRWPEVDPDPDVEDQLDNVKDD